MPRSKVRRPWPSAQRVTPEEPPKPAAVGPTVIARAMDTTGARHLADDESARLLVALQAEYPELQGCEDWDGRLFQAVKGELWEAVEPLLQYQAVLLGLGRARSKHKRPNLAAIQYCLHNMGSWKVPTTVDAKLLVAQQNNVITIVVKEDGNDRP